MTDHPLSDKPDPTIDIDETPRRCKWTSAKPWAGRPAGTLMFGVYFPATDLFVSTMGGRSTGIPDGVEWLDSIDDLPWAPNARAEPTGEKAPHGGVT